MGDVEPEEASPITKQDFQGWDSNTNAATKPYAHNLSRLQDIQG